MMRINRFTIVLVIAAICFAMSPSAFAYSSTHFATNSKLASGKWVKIKVDHTGVHEITHEELSAMGFSNPQNVKVYGFGGEMLGEVLDASAPDDLPIVPVLRTEGKICFYAKGPVNFTLSNPTAENRYYSRTINPYSTSGYYFLTEGDADDAIKCVEVNSPGTTQRASSLDCFYHEAEKESMGYTGRDLLGEQITSSNNEFDFETPGLVPGSIITCAPCVAARITRASSGYSGYGYLLSALNMGGASDTLTFTTSTSSIKYSDSSLMFYNSANPVGGVTPTNPDEKGKLAIDFNIPTDLALSWARMDWFTITYEHYNDMKLAANGQLRMGFNALTASDRIEMKGLSNGAVVWNINNPAQPVEYKYADYQADDASTVKAFTPGIAQNWSQFVVFDPNATLYKISAFEPVENQNLHSLATPDMVIVTNKMLMEQAERVAEMHRSIDGFTVHVVDQEQVFNEFSSGTPDAMAIRLMNKMLYDRNQAKFKYLLMFGCGSFDNRGITTNKKNRIITYQSVCSNDENNSYVADDFFGVLADNTGKNITNEALKIGVGRIPSADPNEARSDVDKLLNYVNNPDWGAWRNNALVTSDEGDNNKHLFQAIGIEEMLNTDLKSGMVVDKACVDLFPNASATSESGVAEANRTAVEARRHIIEALKKGQNFYTYVGHAGIISYTKVRHMWTMTEAQTTEYEHLPIFTTACCDVARYDSHERGIAEVQFHKKNGGAIAIFTTSRSVFADNNDKLNRAWVNAMYSYLNKKTQPRLGDIYLTAKQVFGTSSVPDKVKWLLLGDPAMTVYLPKPLFNITEINNTPITESTTVTVRPMQKLTVKAEVKTLEGALDEAFNGDAVLTLYDHARFYKDITSTFNNKAVTRSVYYPRNQIAQVKGRVVAGKFEGSVIVPRFVEALWEKGLVSVYAHKDNSTQMVNGITTQVSISPYNAANGATITDTNAPVIEHMYFNEPNSFAEGGYIPANSTLYIKASDDVALSNMSVGIGNAMTLKLDNGKETYSEITSFASLDGDGKQMEIAFPMKGLSLGQHSLTYTVHDVAGNETSHTIKFFVGSNNAVTLSTAEIPAIDKATFVLDSSTQNTPTVHLKVTDAAGNLVWTKKTSSFPYTWDLKDKNGKKLAPGLYRYFGTYETSNEYGGTPIEKLIVIDHYNQAQE
ncbi:MAG: type IX secretion system sortase PorU [Sodaliphilus sp.]